jgi:hypothetical protein
LSDEKNKILKSGFQIALPAFNCTSTSTINAVLEAARGLRYICSSPQWSLLEKWEWKI